MRITLNLEINNRPDKTGLYAVMLRLHAKGEKPARLLTGVQINNLKKFWNPDKTWERWIKTAHPYHHELNAKLKAFYLTTQTTIDSWQKAESLTPEQIKAKLVNVATGTVFGPLAYAAIKRFKRKAINTTRNKERAVDSLLSVLGEAIQLEELTPDKVQLYQNTLTKRGLSTGTINQYMSCLNTTYVEVLVGQNTPRKRAKLLSPFLDVESLEWEPVKKDDFKPDQIEVLKKVTFNRVRQPTLDEQTALSIWLLCYQLAGMRISDALLLRYRNFATDETGALRCTYEMKKNGKLISIPASHIGDAVSRFVKPGYRPDDYILPFLKNTAPYANLLTREQIRSAPVAIQQALEKDIVTATRRINAALKRLTQQAGIEGDMTTHTARHSLAMQAQLRVNAGTLARGAVQIGMAHDSPMTTRGYTGKEIIRADEVIESVFGK